MRISLMWQLKLMNLSLPLTLLNFSPPPPCTLNLKSHHFLQHLQFKHPLHLWLENSVSAKFIEQKAASDHATQRFNRLIGTLADASVDLKEHQEKLEIVLQGILANSQADVFNTKETLSQISKTRLSFALLVDDLESMKNLSAHIDEEMSALKKEFKVLNRPGTDTFCKGSVDTTISGVDTMVQNKGRNVKKSPSQVDTSPEQVDTKWNQVDTREPSQKACFSDGQSRSTRDEIRSTLESLPRRAVLLSGT
ncbi:hypothetical protein Taro_012278 [Colocasia esculenta]|uniref:Uncharacterized protein n=1 Tax=Colocasia esculenta TaxID=4460 RepID=A0A843UF46_COLES|nr:hypothetical protein [Colocasia esculenta]